MSSPRDEQAAARRPQHELLASALDAVVGMDADGLIVSWNARAEEMFGWSSAEAIGRPMDEVLVPVRYRRRHRAGLKRYLTTGKGRILERRIELEALHRDGHEIAVELAVVAIRRNGQTEFTGFLRDLSRERAALAALKESDERYRMLVERLPGIVYIDEPGARGRYISPQIESLLGYSAEEWLADPAYWEVALHPDDRERAVLELAAGEQSGRRFTSEYRLIARDGSVVWIRDEATPIHDAAGSLLVHGVMFDVTREREVEAELAAEVAERAEVANALSTFHPGPDPQSTAAALSRELVRLRDLDIAVVYAFLGEGVTPLAYVAPPGAPIAVGRPLPTSRSEYLRSASARGPWIDEWREGPSLTEYERAWLDVGLRVAVFVPLSLNGEPYGLIAVGSTSELAASQIGRRLPAILEYATVANALLGPQLRQSAGDLHVRALRDLIDSGSVRTVFQPVVRLSDRAVVGYEALTRFTDGSSPVQRFAEAERVGLAVELERAAVASAILAAGSLPSGPWLSINISPAVLPQLRQLASLTDDVQRPLVVEITERMAIEDYGAARRLLRRHLPNARIAVDDAGAGFASLRHIAELRPAIVKLDMQLVRNVHRDPAREALVAGMVHFARASGCELIAEGIEVEQERAALMRLGVDRGQGFLLGRPDAVIAAA
ncbi:MAG TPA: EAL domain-containing protein [Candidatus Limnocylindria bacterium]|nr:EAL domain-containing protein [Candidatus Limnocylindria bacterium]